MECKCCKMTYNDEYSFCPSCGEANREYIRSSNTITTGNNSVNIGLGNNSKQEIFIDKYNVIKEKDDLIVEYIDRPDRKVIGGMYSFKLKFEIAVILSIIAALITIVDFLFTCLWQNKNVGYGIPFMQAPRGGPA